MAAISRQSLRSELTPESAGDVVGLGVLIKIDHDAVAFRNAAPRRSVLSVGRKYLSHASISDLRETLVLGPSMRPGGKPSLAIQRPSVTWLETTAIFEIAEA